MIWALIAVALVGMAAGWFFVAPAAVLLSVLTVLGAVAAGLYFGWPALTITGAALALTAVMQLGFLLGAVLAHGRQRMRGQAAGTAKARRDSGKRKGPPRPGA